MLKLYNTLTNKVENFVPLNPPDVGMYICGPTVYDYFHIGNARTFIMADIIRRYLEFRGYKVNFVMNLTDIDDRIIKKSIEENVPASVVARKYSEAFFEDIKRLRIKPATHYPKATENIEEILGMIKELIENGAAYNVDGNIFYNVSSFKSYGKLSGKKIDELEAGARVEVMEEKQNPLDFALWKKAKPGEPKWSSPWGPGRPGWHIECSAMSSKFLGLPFDIHGGGMDLQFPHHENEVAQAEAATGKQFSRFWMHVGLLTVNSEKMSKSIGNIINVKDLLKTWDAEVLRMFFAQAHYRSPPDFNEKALTDIEKGRERLYRVKERLEEYAKQASQEKPSDAIMFEKEYLIAITELQEAFEQAMDDDFNTPKAFASLFEFINKSNKFFEQYPQPNPELCKHALDVYLNIGSVLTLFQPKTHIQIKKEPDVTTKLQALVQSFGKTLQTPTIDELIKALLFAREDARKHKDWKTADQIRNNLEELGFEIQDTNKGPVWRRK